MSALQLRCIITDFDNLTKMLKNLLTQLHGYIFKVLKGKYCRSWCSAFQGVLNE